MIVVAQCMAAAAANCTGYYFALFAPAWRLISCTAIFITRKARKWRRMYRMLDSEALTRKNATRHRTRPETAIRARRAGG